jgi:hypothetical protein
MSWTDTLRDLGREIKAVDSGRRSLRNFGLLMTGALAVVGLLAFWRDSDIALTLVIAAAIFLTLGLLLPRALWPIHKIWMSFAIPLGWLMTRFILTLVFFLALTPTALIGRLLGKCFLDQKFDPDRQSYWEARQNGNRKLEDYRRQF